MQRDQDEQTKLWNGPAGHAWVDAQPLLDRVFKPFEELIAAAVSATSRTQVLDIGCGTGATTLAVAQSLGSRGRCTGVDISEPMIAAARTRAEREGIAARFICANAQTHAFAPASVDMMVSRFGIMFFDDPVGAFANLRRAATDDAELLLIPWRGAAENPFMTTAEQAAAPLLPDLPARRPDAPGQFAFANAQKVQTVLEQSGWTSIAIQPLDVVCTLPANDLLPYVTRLGPVGLALQNVDDTTRARVIEAIRPAFDRFVHGAEVRFTAACWQVTARAAAASQT